MIIEDKIHSNLRVDKFNRPVNLIDLMTIDLTINEIKIDKFIVRIFESSFSFESINTTRTNDKYIFGYFQSKALDNLLLEISYILRWKEVEEFKMIIKNVVSGINTEKSIILALDIISSEGFSSYELNHLAFLNKSLDGKYTLYRYTSRGVNMDIFELAQGLVKLATQYQVNKYVNQ